MWRDLYIAEKTRELELERLKRSRHRELARLGYRKASVFGRLAAIAGRSLRRVGEALELWATPVCDREKLRIALTRPRRSD